MIRQSLFDHVESSFRSIFPDIVCEILGSAFFVGLIFSFLFDISNV